MGRFFRFFLGTPRRFLATLIGVAAVAAVEHFQPGAVQESVYRAGFGILNAALQLVNQFMVPLIVPVGAIAIALYGIKTMFRGFTSGGRRRR